MKFAIKTLVVAAALAAGAAQASINTFDSADGAGGSLVLDLWNQTAQQSATFDLGLDTIGFTPAAFSTAGTQVSWNLNTGTLNSTGSFDVSSLLAGVSGDWSAAWNTFAPSLAGASFAVVAGDHSGSTAPTQYYLSTSSSTLAAVKTTSNTNILGFFTNVNPSLVAANNLGNNPSVANGADVTDSSSAAYQGAAKALADNWHNQAPFTATGNIGSDLAFYSLQGVGSLPLTKVAVNQFGGVFDLNADSGVLTYTVAAAVPEPETYAMLLAGLGMLGMIARRRIN